MTSLANSRMLFSATSIGMPPYLKRKVISSVPKDSASLVTSLMTLSGLPQGWES